MNEFEQVITSSPLFTPTTCNARVNASVPEFKSAQYLAFVYFSIFVSNILLSPPNIKLLFFKTFLTYLIIIFFSNLDCFFRLTKGICIYLL
jgi:hypothetical protein